MRSPSISVNEFLFTQAGVPSLFNNAVIEKFDAYPAKISTERKLRQQKLLRVQSSAFPATRNVGGGGRHV
jgi:hypothetical protein